MKGKIIFGAVLILTFMFLLGHGTAAKTLNEVVKGRILLQVEQNGEAWYVFPGTLQRHYLGRPADAFDIMRELGLGVSEGDYWSWGAKAPAKLAGKILLRVHAKGEAYYVNPVDLKMHYLGRPADAFDIMRNLGLGISNANLAKVQISLKSKSLPAGSIKSIAKLISSVYSCSACGQNQKCVNGKCVNFGLTSTNICGNYICEAGESFDGIAESGQFTKCALDCSASCSGSENCNNDVKIECGCKEYNVLAERHGCIKSAPKCTNCGAQEDLFPELLKIQTDVVKCLQDYFQYKPNRIIYKVFYNPTLDACTEQDGCSGIEGGAGGPDYVMFHNLNGFRAFGKVVPTKASYLTADVHETTHYFLYQMLHSIPSWFHEAIAIQTNERLDCTSRQSNRGDAYLKEKDTDAGGINMSDGTYLNDDFYKRLKAGQTSLNGNEKNNHYLTAALFLMGLKNDYNCGFECIGDVVIKLREYEQNACRLGSKNDCSVSNLNGTWGVGWLGGLSSSEKKANALIKEKFEEVIGKDITTLFSLVNIKY